MRNFSLFIIFIITGLFLAVFIGFDFDSITSAKYVDDEQDGLKKQTIIRFSHVLAENTPKGRTARRFAQLIEEKTNGKVKVHIFPNATLYNESNEWDAVRNGNVEMIAPTTANLSEQFPAWQLLDLPFAFPTYQAVTDAYQGKIGQTLLQKLGHTDVKGMGFWYNGYKQITNNKHPILSPSDFRRLHFRAMAGPVIKEQFDQLEASTSNLPFNKTYRNLEVNFIDGQENTISNIYTKKFYRLQKYLTISNHGYIGYGVLINRTFWNSLPHETQQLINQAMKEATDWSCRHSIEINDQQTRELKQTNSIEIHILSEKERKQWKEALQPVYEKTEEIVGDDLMDELKRIQANYQH